MNFRLIFHLLKTDWQRLRWGIAACWVLAIIAAWPALTFSAGHFDNPSPMPTEFYRHGSIQSDLVAQGEISPMTDWTFRTADWLLTGVGLIVAGALGFHTRSWTEGRPVRKWEAIAARVMGLAIFLMIPLLAVAPATSLVHGFGTAAASRALVESAAILVPRLLAVCLFGALCGGWSRWISGMFAFFVASLMVPAVLGFGPGREWIFRSLAAGLPFAKSGAQAWLAVAILCGVLALTSRHMNPWRKIVMALAALLILPALLPPRVATAAASTKLPDWSASVEPALANLEFAGTITTDPDYRASRTFPPLDHKARLQLQYEWQTAGLPPGVFAMWNATGNGNLISGNQIISSRVPGGRAVMMYNGAGPTGLDKHALTAAVSTDDEPLKWKSFHFGELAENANTFDLFDAIEPGEFKTARLETELKGTAYRIVKILDVPFGQPAEATVDGVRIHVRRLDIVGSWPVADLCYVTPTSSKRAMSFPRHGLPGFDWIPALHFPKTGEYQLLDNAYGTHAELATGSIAVRRMYWACERIQGRKPDTEGFENARFLLLKREDLAILSKQFRSETLPLLIQEQGGSPDARDFPNPPPFQFRPDPATATDQEFNKWMIRSYNAFDSQGWDSRNIADFLPRLLDQVLQRGGGVQPPSTPEGKAIALACPESRRDEVIAALLRRNAYPQGNWIPDVILRRGWVNEAAPQIREMAAQGKIGDNPYSLVMVMALEDPQTYPAILDQRMWFEVYQQARRLPGIEPALTESIANRYQAKPKNDDGDARDRMSHCLAAAAHGIPDAFAKLLKEWHAAPDNDRGVFAEYLQGMVALPGNPDNWRAVIAALAGKSADDFHYDTLARRWVPVSATSR